MLVSDMIDEIKLRDDRVDSFLVQAFTDSDILKLLNEQQTAYIRKVVSDIQSAGFQATKTRTLDIRPWFRSATFIGGASRYKKGRLFAYSNSIDYILGGSITVTYKGKQFQQECDIISIEDVDSYVTTPHYMPVIKNPVMFVDSVQEGIHVLTDIDKILASTLLLYYTEPPKKLVTTTPTTSQLNNTDYPEHINYALINMTVEAIREAREAPSQQLTENTNRERI